MKIRRPKALDLPSFIYGIQIAADVAKDYDKHSLHPYLVSDCILGKLNVLKGPPRKNKDAKKVDALIASIEKKVDSIQGMTRFIYGLSQFQKAGRQKNLKLIRKPQ